MKRWFLPILLVMILLNPVYAAFAETPESTVLTVACEEHDVWWMQKAADRFSEQHPGVEVRFEIMTTEQMDDALENGTNVDVFLTVSNFTNLDRLVHQGLIAPLSSETLLANMAKMYAPFRDYVTYQQQVYAYPRAVLANTRTVNTELLRMYGSFLGEVPTTMSEYIEQMRKWYDTSITVGSDSSFTDQNVPETLLEYTLDELVIAYLCEYNQTDGTRGTYRDFSTSDFADMLDSLDFLRVADFQMNEAEKNRGMPPHGAKSQAVCIQMLALHRSSSALRKTSSTFCRPRSMRRANRASSPTCRCLSSARTANIRRWRTRLSKLWRNPTLATSRTSSCSRIPTGW